jgi:hypothetical protein
MPIVDTITTKDKIKSKIEKNIGIDIWDDKRKYDISVYQEHIKNNIQAFLERAKNS